MENYLRQNADTSVLEQQLADSGRSEIPQDTALHRLLNETKIQQSAERQIGYPTDVGSGPLVGDIEIIQELLDNPTMLRQKT